MADWSYRSDCRDYEQTVKGIMMQIQPITELAYVQATMTLDAMRTELLLSRAQVNQLKERIVQLQKELDNAVKSSDK